VDRPRSLRSALLVGLSSLFASALPLLPYAFMEDALRATCVAVALSIVSLSSFGAYKARLTVGSPWKSAAQLAAIGKVVGMFTSTDALEVLSRTLRDG
jgi:predicted membrane protein (TIGR00267 family)